MMRCLWNIIHCTCNGITKLRGAAKQVRFQPPFGNLLHNSANLTDVETQKFQFCLKRLFHFAGIRVGSILLQLVRTVHDCGNSIRGKCFHELHAFGNKFRSCTFHPRYSQLWIHCGYQSLELWNPTESCKTWMIHAHNWLITSLAA